MLKDFYYYILLGFVAISIAFGVYKLTPKENLAQPYESANNTSNEDLIAPGNYFDLENWKLTLPINTDKIDGDPDEITYPELKNFANEYFYYDKSKKAMVFIAPAKGDETDNTKYTRSELREMPKNGEWSSSKGSHSIEIEQAITSLPKNKPHVVVGQIHDEDDDVYVFRLEGKKLYANSEDEENDITFTEDYELGQKFKVKFEVENDETKIFYNGKLKHIMKRKFSDAYFKAGAYIQASCSYSSGKDYEAEDCKKEIPFAQIEIYSLKVCHDSECY